MSDREYVKQWLPDARIVVSRMMNIAVASDEFRQYSDKSICGGWCSSRPDAWHVAATRIRSGACLLPPQIMQRIWLAQLCALPVNRKVSKS